MEEIFRKAMNREFIFKLRAKAEQYNVNKITFFFLFVSFFNNESYRYLLG